MGVKLISIPKPESYFNYELICSGRASEFHTEIFPYANNSILSLLVGEGVLEEVREIVYELAKSLRNSPDTRSRTVKLLRNIYRKIDTLTTSNYRIATSDERKILGLEQFPGDVITFDYEYRRKLFIPEQIELVNMLYCSLRGERISCWINPEYKSQYGNVNATCQCGKELSADHNFSYIFLNEQQEFDYVCCRCLVPYIINRCKPYRQGNIYSDILPILDFLLLCNSSAVLSMFLSREEDIKKFLQKISTGTDIVIPVVRMLALTSAALRHYGTSSIVSKKTATEQFPTTSSIVQQYFINNIYDISSIVNDSDLENISIVMNKVIFNPNSERTVLQPSLTVGTATRNLLIPLFSNDFIEKVANEIKDGYTNLNKVNISVFAYDTKTVTSEKTKRKLETTPMDKEVLSVQDKEKLRLIEKVYEGRGARQYSPMIERIFTVKAIVPSQEGYNFYLVDENNWNYILNDEDGLLYKGISKIVFPNMVSKYVDRQSTYDIYLGPGSTIKAKVRVIKYDSNNDIFTIVPVYNWKYNKITGDKYRIGVQAEKLWGPIEQAITEIIIEKASKRLAEHSSIDQNTIKNLLRHMSIQPSLCNRGVLARIKDEEGTWKTEIDHITIANWIREALKRDVYKHYTGGPDMLIKYMDIIDANIREYIYELSDYSEVELSEDAPEELKQDQSFIYNLSNQIREFISSIVNEICDDLDRELENVFKNFGYSAM